MSVTHSDDLRSAIADLVTMSLGASGRLVFKTSVGDTVATLLLLVVPFASAIDGVAIANSIVDDTDAIGGVIDRAELQTSAGTARVFCSVTETGYGGDIEMPSLTVAPGQTVSMPSLRYIAPV